MGRLGSLLGASCAILGRLEAVLGHLGTILGHLGTILGGSWVGLGGVLGDLGGSWGQEIEKIATAGSHHHPGEAKSVIRIAFLAVSAEQKKGSRHAPGEDRGGTFRDQVPREGG